jgi:hypothetical protein
MNRNDSTTTKSNAADDFATAGETTSTNDSSVFQQLQAQLATMLQEFRQELREDLLQELAARQGSSRTQHLSHKPEDNDDSQDNSHPGKKMSDDKANQSATFQTTPSRLSSGRQARPRYTSMAHNDDDDEFHTDDDLYERRHYPYRVLRVDPALPTFGGDEDEDAFRWLIAFEEIAEANGWDSFRSRRHMLARYLVEGAKQWWLNSKDEIIVWDDPKAGPFDDYTFRGAFLSAFVGEHLVREWQYELRTAVQTDRETPLEYYNRFTELVTRCRVFEDLNEESMINQFLRGLPTALHVRMLDYGRNRPYTSLKDVGRQLRAEVQLLSQAGDIATMTSHVPTDTRLLQVNEVKEERKKIQSPFVRKTPPVRNTRERRTKNTTRPAPVVEPLVATQPARPPPTAAVTHAAPPPPVPRRPAPPVPPRPPAGRSNRAAANIDRANPAFAVPAPAAPVEDIDALTRQMQDMRIHYNRRGRPIATDAHGNPLEPCPNCRQIGHWRAQCPYAARPVFQ